MGFDGLVYASRALQAQQQALYVTGENLANLNAPGYTRQRVTPQVQPAAPLTLAPTGGMGPGGPLFPADGVERLRDQFLDGAIRSQASTLSAAQSSATIYSQLDNAFDETSQPGLNATIGTFLSQVQSVALLPEDLSLRQSLLEQARTLASTFSQQAGQIQSQRIDAERRSEQAVASANQILQQLAQLNAAIPVRGTSETNAVQDQRDQLLDDLSELMDIQVAVQPQGDIVVYQGSVPLVYGRTARTLSVTRDAGVQGEAAGATLNISRVRAGTPFVVGNAGTLTLQGSLIGPNPVIVNVGAADDETTVINNINTALAAAGVTGVTAADNGGSIFLTANKLSRGNLSTDIQVTAAGGGATVAGFAASVAGTATGPTAIAADTTAVLARSETLGFTDGLGHNANVTLAAGTTIAAAVNSIQLALNNASIQMTVTFDAANQRIDFKNLVSGSATTVTNAVRSNVAAANFGGLQIVGAANTDSVVASGMNFAGAAVQVGRDPNDQVTTDSGRTLTDVGATAGALMEAYNTGLPGFATRLDAVANAIIASVNQRVANCYDLNGNAGTALFSGTSAASMAVALSDPRALAISAASRQGTALYGSGLQVDGNQSLTSQNPNLATALTATSGVVSINGHLVNWNDGMTLNQVLAQFPPGITAKFDPTTQRVTLQRNPAGDTDAQPDIVLADLAGNLVSALHLDVAPLNKGTPGDASGAKAILALNTSSVMGTPPSQTISQGMQAVSTSVASTAQGWHNEATTANSLQKALEAKRTSISGVDSDEEATHLMQFQRGYEAAVRLANAQDELLKTLINTIGVH